MTGFIIRCIVAAITLSFNTYLFYTGYWGWGIFVIFISALVVLSFFKNENMILALNQMRVGNTDKALKYINRITHPHLMPRKQHAYILFLQAVMSAQSEGMTQSEHKLRKAIGLGLRKAEDNAMARMHLAGICAQTGEKRSNVFTFRSQKIGQFRNDEGANTNNATTTANGSFKKSNANGANDGGDEKLQK